MIRSVEIDRDEDESEAEVPAAKTKKPQGGIKDIQLGKSDVFKLDPRAIKVKEGWNSRNPDDPANAEHIEALAQSIAEYGVQTPLTVFWEDNAPVVVDGHCRLAACMLAISRGAELVSVPVIVTPRHHNEIDRIFAQIVKNMGKKLEPIEQARVYRRLLDLGADEKGIAAKAGITVHRLQELIRLQAAPWDVTDLVVRKKVSANLASKTIAAHKGNTAAAVESLKNAVAKAEADGRDKAMPKDVDPIKDAQLDMIAEAAQERTETAPSGTPGRHPAYVQALKDALALAERVASDADAEFREGGFKMIQVIEDLIAGRKPRIEGDYSTAEANTIEGEALAAEGEHV